jgi:hypothetical protein
MVILFQRDSNTRSEDIPGLVYRFTSGKMRMNGQLQGLLSLVPNVRENVRRAEAFVDSKWELSQTLEYSIP